MELSRAWTVGARARDSPDVFGTYLIMTLIEDLIALLFETSGEEYDLHKLEMKRKSTVTSLQKKTYDLDSGKIQGTKLSVVQVCLYFDCCDNGSFHIYSV
jgi:uncharacterized protein YlxW (UPF0749 family)